MKQTRSNVRFSDELQTKLCELLTSGKSLKDALARRDMPTLHQFTQWKQRNESFSKAIDEALRLRAMVYESDLADVARDAEKATTTQQIAALRLRADILTKLCQFADPKRYSQNNQQNAVDQARTWVDFMRTVNEEREGKRAPLSNSIDVNVNSQDIDVKH